MADQSIIQRLANYLKSGAPEAPLGNGMADQARQTLQNTPKYRDYVIEMQSNGQQPLTPQQWMQQQQQTPQVQPVPTQPEAPPQPFRF